MSDISKFRENLEQMKHRYEDIFSGKDEKEKGRGARPKTSQIRNDIVRRSNLMPAISDPYPTSLFACQKLTPLETELRDVKRELEQTGKQARHYKRQMSCLAENVKELEKTVKEYEDLLKLTLNNAAAEIEKAGRRNRDSFEQTAKRNEELVKQLDEAGRYKHVLEEEIKELREGKEDEFEYNYEEDEENVPYMTRKVRVVSPNKYPDTEQLALKGVFKR